MAGILALLAAIIEDMCLMHFAGQHCLHFYVCKPHLDSQKGRRVVPDLCQHIFLMADTGAEDLVHWLVLAEAVKN